MVRARFKTEGGRLTMRVNGHAGAGPKGFDIVCAGASIFAFTIAECFRRMWEEGKLEHEPLISTEKTGRVVVTAEPKEAYMAEALHTMDVAKAGFKLLEDHYPEHAKLILLEPVREDSSK